MYGTLLQWVQQGPFYHLERRSTAAPPKGTMAV